jgi:streptogramin lyase
MTWGRMLVSGAVAVALLATSAPANAGYAVVDTWGQFGIPPSAYRPSGVAVDASGNAYVVDQELDEVVKFNAAGTAVGAFGRGSLQDAQGAAVDSTAGVLYVADQYQNQVERFTTATGARLTPWAANTPTDVDVDSAGNVYISESNTGQIVKRAPDGTQLAQIGSLGSTNGKLSGPTGVAVDATGSVYVADAGNGRVQQFASDGTYLNQWAISNPSAIAVYASSV